MGTLLPDALDFLKAQSFASLLALYWYIALFEIPRYGVSFLVAALFRPAPPGAGAADGVGRLSAIIAGHNEEEAIERCVLALHEQSRPPDEIIVVSDGSTDRMSAVIARLLRQGLIQQAHATDLRGGTSSGVNLAARWATGDILMKVDCDCSFDRHALRNILTPFQNPAVGAVSGNILVRNPGESLVAAFQAIEYMISISLGKQAADALGQVACVSGAFGAFRHEAFEAVGGMDAGGGEDLDFTLRLRREGWEVRFAADAICYTDVPATLIALIRQRFRWERDAVRLRYRKHGEMMNPFSHRFRPRELLHEVEFLGFNVIAAAALPFYLLGLFASYGGFALIVLAAAQAGLLLLDLASFLLAAHATPRARAMGLLWFLPGYTVFNGFFMRFIRLAAYAQEWAFDRSYSDPYVPNKVHRERL
ncbi:glycosyltransferase [Rhodobacteraceae bacterium GS-10]|uniref:Glycosyltransferase n=2 Tax=Thalassovita mangrovi TaxID=2692236 RepID=A0A6L8LW99_9RHOB|nr:glycosyltransferase [Thalassovita mangrovi]